MIRKCQNFLNSIDIIGVTPQLLIFNNKRYKSIFTSITSLLIIIFSIIFAIFSLIQYLKFKNPIIVYSKANDEKTQRRFNLNDTLLMFQLTDTTGNENFNSSIAYYEGEYSIMYDNGTYLYYKLDIENCEIGKNIDIKYKEYINEKYKFGKNIEDFYCINRKNKDISLFYYPNIGFSYIRIFTIIKNQNEVKPENIKSLIASENDLIDHNNKKEPINKNYIYKLTSGYSSSEYTEIDYNFQYIKYESDEGLFYESSRILNGISFSDINFIKSIPKNYNLKDNLEKYNSSEIGVIRLEINKSYFDDYKRSYQKVQSLLAEVMTVVNLLLEIGIIISDILCDKKMSKDIIRSILNSDNQNSLNQKNKKINRLFNDKETNILSLERKKIDNYLSYKRSCTEILQKNDDIKLNMLKNSNNIPTEVKVNKVNKQNIINKILKSLNYYHIIKSFFCFKDDKTKIINFCHKIINEDMSVERILERFYNLERIYNFVYTGEKEKNLIEDKRFNELNKYIYNLNDEYKKRIISDSEIFERGYI